MASRSQTLAAVSASCGVFGAAGWIFYILAFRGLHGEDWMVFFTAARMVIEGKLAVLYDGDTLTAALNAHFAPWLAHRLPLHPFLYPPHYLLLLVPFGFLPPLAAAAAFLVLSFVALIAALFRYARDRDEHMFLIAAVLLCPATATVVCLGQNSFLTCALLVGGLAVSRERPILGGLLLGALSYKPQLALMAPVALVAARQWKTLAAACVCTLALMLASFATFGIEPWRAWFELMTAPSDLFQRWNTIARLNGQSVYAYAVFLGAPASSAHLLQIGSAIGAACLVYWVQRGSMVRELKLAVLLVATTFAAPHLLDYDALLLGIAAALFFMHTLREGPQVLDSAIACLIWLSPLVNPPTAFHIGAATPFLALLFVAMILRRGSAAAVSSSAIPAGALGTNH